MPQAKIGAYGACIQNPKSPGFVSAFLDRVRADALPLDFFSWHIYTCTIGDFKTCANEVRDTLDQYGFQKSEIFLTEWNYIPGNPWGKIFDCNYNGADSAAVRRECFTEMGGMVGASFTAAALVELTALPVDIANHYDGQPVNNFCSIFDRYGNPTKQFYAFVAFNHLARFGGERIAVSCGKSGVHATAVASEKGVCAMVANYKGTPGECGVEWVGLDTGKRYDYELHVLDEDRDLGKALEIKNALLRDLPRTVDVRSNSVVLLTIRGV